VKTEGKVRHKLKQVLYRHLKKRLKSNFRRLPCTCRHNADVDLGDGSTIGICMFPVEDGPRGMICDKRLAGHSQAQRCDLFDPMLTKEEVKEAFRAVLEGEPGEIAAAFPDAAALMWVLDEFDTEMSEIGTEIEKDPEVLELWEDEVQRQRKGWRRILPWGWGKREI